MDGDTFRPAGKTGVHTWIPSLREAVIQCALGQGMAPADAEDCAQEAVLGLLISSPDCLPQGAERHLHAWLRAVARHDVLDYARHLARERNHTVALSSHANEDNAPYEGEIRDSSPTPEDALVSTLFWELLVPAVDALEDDAHFYFIRYHLLGQDARSIATTGGTTEKHVYRVLEKARRHIAKWLAQHGVTEQDLRAALPVASPVPLLWLAAENAE